MYYDSDEGIYTDMLIGQYKYIANGIEIINTLSNLDSNNPFNNNIFGLLLYPNTSTPTSKIVKLNFKDPERIYLNKSIKIKHIDSPGALPDKIQITWSGETVVTPDENSPITLRVPEMEYTLTKQ